MSEPLSEYKPRKRTAQILNWLLEKVDSVPYKVTVRWAFYRCVQEYGLDKKEYKNFTGWLSRARKSFWNGWKPWTLIDDTRNLSFRGGGLNNFEEFVELRKEDRPAYEVYSKQKNIVMVWFEAQAMASQFNYYCRPYRITTVPFKGDPGIEYKWRIARKLAELWLKHRKPIHILYFGDYEVDKKSGSRAKGYTIPLDALKDIEPWFQAIVINQDEHLSSKGYDIRPDELPYLTPNFYRAGLNKEHIRMFSLPENPERPGEYQWESLDDDEAGKLIVEAIESVWGLDAVKEVERKEDEDHDKWVEMMDNLEGE